MTQAFKRHSKGIQKAFKRRIAWRQRNLCVSTEHSSEYACATATSRVPPRRRGPGEGTGPDARQAAAQLRLRAGAPSHRGSDLLLRSALHLQLMQSAPCSVADPLHALRSLLPSVLLCRQVKH